MDDNAVSGPIPVAFCMLADLRVLSLASNQVAGTLPKCIGKQITSLTTIDLSKNAITNFPDSMYELKLLRVLDLSHNSIGGTISNDLLPNLMSLTFANLAWNRISGTIPESFAILPDLATMYLDHK